MKNILTKKKFVALFAMVCAFVLLLVGIPFAAAPASAAETRGTYIPDKPQMLRYAGNAAVKTVFIGDENLPSGAETSLSFGNNTNLNQSTRYVSGNSYTEVEIPDVNSKGIGPNYFWARSTTKLDNVYYQSDPLYIGVSDIFNAKYPVAGRVVSGNFGIDGTIVASLPAGTNIYFCSFIYQTWCFDFAVTRDTEGTVIAHELTGDAYQITLRYSTKNDTFILLAPWDFTAASLTNSVTSGTGGFAFYAM